MKWCDTIIISWILFFNVFNKQFTCFQMTLLSSPMKWGPALICWRIFVFNVFKKHFANFYMIFMCSIMERSPIPTIICSRIFILYIFDDKSTDFQMTICSCPMKGCFSIIVCRVFIFYKMKKTLIGLMHELTISCRTTFYFYYPSLYRVTTLEWTPY